MRGVRVECYAGGRADEEPRRVWDGDRPCDVRAIRDRAESPEERRFLVTLADGRRCQLVQAKLDGSWSLRPA